MGDVLVQGCVELHHGKGREGLASDSCQVRERDSKTNGDERVL